MAKLHLPGDWAAPLALALAGGTLYFSSTLKKTEYVIPGENVLGIFFLVSSLWLGLLAFRGRAIEDESVYYYWKALEASFSSVIFGAALVFFGSNFLLMNMVALISETYAKTAQYEFSIYLTFLAVGFLVFAYYFLFHARVVVFNKDKTFLTMIGKPWSWTRHYQANDFKELVVNQGLSYAGQSGMVRYFQKHYFVFAINGKKRVLLMRDNSLEDAKVSLQELSKLTGLSVASESPIINSKIKIEEKKTGIKNLLRAPSCLGPLSQLQKKFPTAHVLDKIPEEFPNSNQEKIDFEERHFIMLLRATRVPYYFHGSTPIQEDIWFFKNPLIVSLKFLSVFEEFSEAAAVTPNDFVAFTDVVFSWKEFGWMPDRKYPPLDVDEETRWWWGRQGKDKI